MLKKALSPLFNKWLTEREALLNEEREIVLETLKTYLKTSHDKLKDFLESDTTPEKSKGYGVGYSTSLNFDILTRKDLQSIQQDLYALHALAQKHNVTIFIDGLDYLPRLALTTRHSMSTINNNQGCFDFNIAVDTRQPYNHMVNPYDTKAIKQYFKHP